MIENIRKRLRQAWSREVCWRCRQLSGLSYDYLFNVRTSKIVFLTGLNIASVNVREAYTYEATPWALLPKIIRRMRICVQPYSFVDYGSGKGRQVLSAARFPFREVIGVEFSPELCEIAEHNLHECRWLPRRAGRIRIVCSDALDFEPPAGPSLLFFFRPFGTKLMREVLTEVHRAWLEENRKIYLLLCGFLSKDMEDIRSLSFLSEVQRGMIRCDLFYKVPVYLVEMGNSASASSHRS